MLNNTKLDEMDHDTVQGRVLLSISRTMYTPGRQLFYRHQHRKANPPRVLRRAVAYSKYLCFLWFLVICDSQTASRVPFRTLWLASASSIGVPSTTPHWDRWRPTEGPSLSEQQFLPMGGDKHSDSIISSAEADDRRTPGFQQQSATVNHTKLQEIVMEGLGLSAIPDVRMVSFC
ncbi:hypothetical protein ZHAS_00018254 [Anopheles sinensis]|uniref:Uncharacterized protein n=1 Tax=Anopheles sinensis TaxID=74873 RepID=A0A084WIZ5_ANOSI|nr:hypothetical protein ZHAS_00018254 [Anopheles sinensis]